MKIICRFEKNYYFYKTKAIAFIDINEDKYIINPLKTYKMGRFRRRSGGRRRFGKKGSRGARKNRRINGYRVSRGGIRM